MPKPINLSSVSVDALLKLRTEIEQVLTRRADQLRNELSKLSASRGRVGAHPLAGRKAPIKYRDRSGNTWAGRGEQPRWLREKLKGGAKLADFAVNKSKKQRRAKR
jgi:DNA-binding protein H-NS